MTKKETAKFIAQIIALYNLLKISRLENNQAAFFISLHRN